MKETTKITLILFVLFFTMSCNSNEQNENHQHNKDHDHNTEHSHDGEIHKEHHTQEEFTINKDSTLLENAEKEHPHEHSNHTH